MNSQWISYCELVIKGYERAEKQRAMSVLLNFQSSQVSRFK